MSQLSPSSGHHEPVRSSIPATVNRTTRMSTPGLRPLQELEKVNVTGAGQFGAVLSSVERHVQQSPILLPEKGEYLFAMKDGALHIYPQDKNLSSYDIVGSAAVQANLSNGTIAVEYQAPDGSTFSYVLHLSASTWEYHFPRPSSSSSSSYSSGTTTSRRTSPWRDDYSTSSESHGGSTSGE